MNYTCIKFIILMLFLFLSLSATCQSLNQAQDYLDHSDYKNAILTYSNVKNQAIKTDNVLLLISSQNGIAECYLDIGANYKAMELLKQNISILNKQKNLNFELLAKTHQLLANGYDKLNLIEDYHNQCITFYKYYQKAFPSVKIYKALYYAYVGRYYNMRYIIDKANFYTSGALKIYHNNKNEKHLVDDYIFYNAHLFTLRNYGGNQENRIKYQDSLNYFINKKYPLDNIKKARIYLSIAAINLDLAANNLYNSTITDNDRRIGITNANIAIDWYNKALAINEKKIGHYNPNSAALNSLKGLMLFYKKDYKTALENYEIGINRITLKDDKTIYPFCNNNPLLMSLLKWKAWCLNDMYDQNKDPKLLYEIEITLLKMEKVWLFYANNTFKNKQSYNANMYISSPYSSLVTLYYNLYNTTNKVSYLEKFYEYDEKSRYTALLENLYQEKKNILNNEITNRDRIKTFKSYEEVMISNNAKISSSKSIKDQLTLFKYNYSKFNKEQTNLFNSKDVLSLKKTQNKLKDNEAIISINYTGKQYDEHPYLFLITNKTTKIINLSTDNVDFVGTKLKVEYLVNLLKNNDIQSYKKVAYEYYEKYFKPIEPYLPKSVNHIKIIPEANFTNLPFDLFLNQKSNSNDFSKLPYLIKKYQFSYGLSASIEDLIDKPISNVQSMSVFSPDFSNTKLSNLNSARSAANQIASQFNVSLVAENNASKSNFEKQLKHDNVLVLLSHGKANSDEDETQKGIYLSDGFLSLNDVYNLKSNTDFLLLGACETGLGFKENNEGTINLARAFTSIGVKSMMLSSWKIDEESSVQIIKSFLTYLDKGHTKSEALQKAKLDYLATSNPRSSNPLFWAGLNSTGNNKTIPLNKTNKYWLLLGLIPLSFGYWFYRRKRKGCKSS